MKYNIYNATLNKDLGTWEGTTSDEALDAMALAGGHRSFAVAQLFSDYRGDLVTTAVGLPSEGRKEQVAHTPLPWHVGPERHAGAYQLVLAESQPSGFVCEVQAPLMPDGTGFDERARQANAAFIVRACNAHEGLVEALRAVLYGTPIDSLNRDMDGLNYRDSRNPPTAADVERWQNVIRNALALAGAA